ncbi:MAG TPA: ABC transporter permease [Thermoanaerobaculia bacterium]|nr:ABC transporter permease [Thermoanaerobaculia bacterium]
MDRLWKDIRFAIRSLRLNPGFALVSILTLALGIGATTAIFSVVNAVLLRPLPLPDPSKLVMVWESQPRAERNVASPRNLNVWIKEVPHTFSSLGTNFDWELSMTGQGDPELVLAGLAGFDLFRTLGARPYLGRTLEARDLTGDAHAVISWPLWQRKFGGDRRVIGRVVQIDGSACTIVGVMPRDFMVPQSHAEIWLPYPMPEQGGRYLTPIARLAPGVTIEQAQARMNVVAKRTQTMSPKNKGWDVLLVPVHEQVVGGVRRSLLIVMIAVALLLAIGCVNIANLLLSRATARAKEMAVRAALGASRGQLVRQLLTESLVLAIVAGIVGAVIAGWATMLFVRFTPESAMLPRMTEIALDGRALLVALLLTLVTGIFFGLAPALEASRTDLNTTLKSATRGSTHDRRGKAFRNALVVIEVALATVLLIGAGLLIKSFAALENVDPGVRAEGAVTARVVFTGANATGERRVQMIDRIVETARHLPGVTSAGAIVSAMMPFSNGVSVDDFLIEGDPKPPEGQEPAANYRPIGGDYFRAMGMTLVAGQMFAQPQRDPHHTDIVVNQAFVQRYFATRNPLGRRLLMDNDVTARIVGVVSNVRAAGLDHDAAAAIYLSYAYNDNTQFTVITATKNDPHALAVPLTRALHEIDPLMPVKNVATLDEMISGTMARPRFNATMLTLFAALGLLLASIGIYGVLSYSVSQRTHEMGIRMALGAEPRDVLRLVVSDGAKVAVIGVVAGLAIAFPATRIMAALLFGISATDATVFITVAATLTAVALLASYVPARRATRVDPMIALRPE